MKKTIKFLVQGSQKEPYKVNFTYDNNHLKATCNCQAAINGMMCKHRKAILTNKLGTVALLPHNVDDLNQVHQWYLTSSLKKDIEALDLAKKKKTHFEKMLKEEEAKLFDKMAKEELSLGSNHFNDYLSIFNQYLIAKLDVSVLSATLSK